MNLNQYNNIQIKDVNGKYTEEFKKHIIEICKTQSLWKLAKELNISAAVIRAWIDPSFKQKINNKSNEHYAKTAKCPERKDLSRVRTDIIRKNIDGTYTEEFKQEVVQYSKIFSAYKAGKDYNVHITLVKVWIDPQYKENVRQKERSAYRKNMEDPIFREKHRQIAREAYKDEEHRNYMKQYVNEHREQARVAVRKCHAKNREIYRANRKVTERALYHSDPTYRLIRNFQEKLRMITKSKGIKKQKHSIEYLGCTSEEFKKHIESQFQLGMTWDNHGKGEGCWHLDHILPASLINGNSSEEMINKIFHYTNLRPLWSHENQQKSDKILPEFQFKLDNILNN